MLRFLKIQAEAEAEAEVAEEGTEAEVAEAGILGIAIATKEEEGKEALLKEVPPVVQEKEGLKEKVISFS
jgi:hypothetical protein